MQNSDSADSSLQAILYIDAPGGKPQKQHRPSRIPGAVAVGACAFAALCAVGAITYSVKQAPLVAVSHDVPLHVTHPAAAQRELKAEELTTQTHSVTHAVAALPLVAVAAPQPVLVVKPIVKPPIPVKKAPAPIVAVATASPIATVAPNVRATPVAIKPHAKIVVLATPKPKPKSSAHAYHHHLRRRLAAYMPGVAAGAVQQHDQRRRPGRIV